MKKYSITPLLSTRLFTGFSVNETLKRVNDNITQDFPHPSKKVSVKEEPEDSNDIFKKIVPQHIIDRRIVKARIVKERKEKNKERSKTKKEKMASRTSLFHPTSYNDPCNVNELRNNWRWYEKDFKTFEERERLCETISEEECKDERLISQSMSC